MAFAQEASYLFLQQAVKLYPAVVYAKAIGGIDDPD
jgi:hypothetical protein